MKRYVLIGIGLCLFFGLFAEERRFPANDSRVTYVGRTLTKDSTVSFDWTGVYMRIAFEGHHLSLRCHDSGCDYLNVWIDREMTAEPDRIVRVSGDTTICLLDTASSDRTAHQVIVQKRTEGEQGRITVYELLTAGELLPALPLKARQLEFIGDSYTCGFGAEESLRTDPFTPQTESAAKSFASVLARAFNADYALIAHSGFGICRNYNSKYAGYYMPERYLQTFDMERGDSLHWNAKKDDFRPQMTIIFLGGNDFSVQVNPGYKTFEGQYIKLIQSIRANYGGRHPILCCTKKGVPMLQEYMRRLMGKVGQDGIYYVSCQDGIYPDDEEHLGACQHPSYEAHRKMACMLIPYVSSILGWQIPADMNLQ